MKKLVLSLLLIVTTYFLSFAQEKKLFEAVQKNKTETVKKLLKNNIDPNVILLMGMVKMNALIAAVNNGNYEIVQLLVEHGAKVDWRDGFNSTALMYAAHGGHRQIIEYLISKGADVNAEDGQGNSVLTAAKEGKNPEIIALIEKNIKE